MYTKTISVTETLIKPPLSEKLKSGCVVLKKNQEVGEHVTKDKEEILIILQGKARIICENEIRDVDNGTFVFIPKNKKHNVVNRSREVLKYIYVVTMVA